MTLESWFAGSNLADVGLILDASGSMAFVSDFNSDKDKEKAIVRVDSKQKSALDELGDGTPWLTKEQVDYILELESNKTSNSLLDYGDYTYFVYDGRESTKEYVPLGYWDGEISSEDEIKKIKTLEDGLIGKYTFGDQDSPDNRNLKNSAPEATDEDKAEVLNGTSTFYSNSGKQKACIQLYKNNSKADYLLDAVLENSKTFTISFALKWNNADLARDHDQNIFYIGDEKMSREEGEYYALFRGTRSSGDSGRWLRLEDKNGNVLEIDTKKINVGTTKTEALNNN